MARQAIVRKAELRLSAWAVFIELTIRQFPFVNCNYKSIFIDEGTRWIPPVWGDGPKIAYG